MKISDYRIGMRVKILVELKDSDRIFNGEVTGLMVSGDGASIRVELDDIDEESWYNINNCKPIMKNIDNISEEEKKFFVNVNDLCTINNITLRRNGYVKNGVFFYYNFKMRDSLCNMNYCLRNDWILDDIVEIE